MYFLVKYKYKLLQVTEDRVDGPGQFGGLVRRIVVLSLSALLHRTVRTDGGEEDGEQDQAVEHSVDHGEAEYLEEGEEDVGGGEGEDDDGEEGGHPSIGYCWTQIHQGLLRLLESCSCDVRGDCIEPSDLSHLTGGHREGVSEVNAVVHTQSSSQDDVHAGDHVDGDVPEVEGPHHVHQGKHDAGHDHQTQVEVAEHDQGHHPHGQQGQAKVPPELQRNDGVRLPSLVDLEI